MKESKFNGVVKIKKGKEELFCLLSSIGGEKFYMSNLSQGIVDDTRAEVIMSMHKKGYSLEQIADVMEKSVEEVEDIIRQEELVTV